MVAVSGIEFEVREKECFGFIGPNGAGKTTTMKMIYCFIPRTSGELLVLDKDPSTHPEMVKADLGVVPQDNNLDEDLNVFTNLTMYANYFNIPHNIARVKAQELLAFVQLTEKQKVKITELSSGMKRRLMIARGLINDPKLLILDEPTVGLDPQARHLIWDRLRELKSQNVSMIITTHYMDEATELCDRVAVMYAGKIAETADVRDLFNKPSHPYTKDLIRSVPNVDEDVAYLKSIEGQPPALDKLPVGCSFASRCPYVFDRCLEEFPIEVKVGGTHSATCWRLL